MRSSPVTGEPVNRDSGYRLEISYEYLLEDDIRSVECHQKKIEKGRNFAKIWLP